MHASDHDLLTRSKHVNPALNSISYAYLLNTIYSSDTQNSDLPDDLAECTAKFLLTFDARQIRYAGTPFSSILDAVQTGQVFPASVTVELLASALLRLDPTGSIFTSHHLPLVHLAYQTQNIEHIHPVISKSIVFYPGMRGQTETRPLCDMRLPSSAYISVESGLTGRVTPAEVMEYDLACGLVHLSQRDWASAAAAFERVVTFPTRDGGCSTLMAQAHHKWILSNLLLTGTLRQASVSSNAQRSLGTLSKPYVELAKAFEKGASEGGAAALKAEAEAGTDFWTEDRNDGLVREVLAHYQRYHVLRLREVYSKIGLEDIRTLTHDAGTGGALEKTSDVEALLRDMISQGMLAGRVEKPAGAVEGDGQGHLTFLSDGEELTEAQFAAELERSAQHIRDLAPIVRATNERLGTSRDYIKHVVKEQKKKEDGGGGGGGGGGGLSSGFKDVMDIGFDSQIEDEDLMTGLVAGA
jgi:COP9 signalosome complex subunit 3